MPKKKNKHKALTIKTLFITSIVITILQILNIVFAFIIDTFISWNIDLRINAILFFAFPIINIIILIYYIFHYWKSNKEMFFVILITNITIFAFWYAVIWPAVKSNYLVDRGNQRFCPSAVNCHNNDDGITSTCQYYDDNGEISKDTIICDYVKKN